MPEKLQLRIAPDWDEIEPAQESARDYLSGSGFSEDVVDALTMVIGELLENAVKYGTYADPEAKVALSVHGAGGAVWTEVSHPVGRSAHDHLRKMERTIQWIRGFQDPFEAYVEQLRKVSQKPLKDLESGLGLFRIAYEGRSILDFFMTRDHTLNISAVFTPD